MMLVVIFEHIDISRALRSALCAMRFAPSANFLPSHPE